MRAAAPWDARRVPTYLVESYGAGLDDAVAEARLRARRAAALGAGIRYLRTTFLPGDETLLHVFEATSREELQRAARRAALAYERIVDAVEETAPGARGGGAL